MARMKRATGVEQGRARAYQRDTNRERFTTQKGKCFVCNDRARAAYPDGTLSMTCLSERCLLEYLPGGRERLARLQPSDNS